MRSILNNLAAFLWNCIATINNLPISNSIVKKNILTAGDEKCDAPPSQVQQIGSVWFD